VEEDPSNLCHTFRNCKMPVGRLKNKTALITGSSSGLGRAIAIRYAYEGANICCVDLYPTPRNMISPSTGKEDRLENRAATGATHETLDDMFSYDEDGNDRFIFVKADMSVPAEAENAVAQCVQFFGRLDIMVNNAGIIVESQHERPLMCHETSEEDYDLTMRVNAKGVFLGCKYACKQMLNQEVWPRLRDDGMEDGSQTEGDRGWIINTASVSAMVASEGAPSYCASKGAVVMLTRQVALDYAKWRIHCNALCPGCESPVIYVLLSTQMD